MTIFAYNFLITLAISQFGIHLYSLFIIETMFREVFHAF